MSPVRLDRLQVTDFRNLERIDLEPGPRFNVIHGPNGAGKTSLLEAIYLLGALRSFRTTTRTELIRHEQESGAIRASFGGAAKGLDVELTIAGSGRRLRVGGKALASSGGHFRELPMVLFHPGHMSLVTGAPEARRRFLDRALFQAEVAYPVLFNEYGRALASRNRLLREPTADVRSLAAYEHELASRGSRLVALRGAFVATLAPLFAGAARRVTGGLEATLGYRPSVAGDEDALVRALAASRQHDRARGFTGIGPHADDVEIELDGRAGRRFASQGQSRALVLALKIAETEALAQATGRLPLVLLDDVSSELDRDRNRRLFEFLSTIGGQVFITTTHLDHVLVDEAERRLIGLAAGRLDAAAKTPILEN